MKSTIKTDTYHADSFRIEGSTLKRYTGLGGHVVIPDGIESIGWQAFKNCKEVTSVFIPESVNKIEREAFRNCSSLVSVNIPNGVREIDDETFTGCNSLSSMVLPEGIEYIGFSAFEGCESLESISLPQSLKVLGDYSFSGCNSLSELEIPKNVDCACDLDCSGVKTIIITGDNTEFRGHEAYPYDRMAYKPTVTILVPENSRAGKDIQRYPNYHKCPDMERGFLKWVRVSSHE